jgi:MFS family permease
VWAAFVCVSIWAAGIIVTAAGTRDVAYARPAQPPQPGLRALVPQWHAHRRALALATIPAVAFILAASFLRNAPGAIQSSLYVLFLGEQGYSATVIGALVGICEFFGVAGSALAAPLERLIRPHKLVVLCIGASILAIALTPLVSFSLMLLVATAGLRGSAQGLSQPLMYSLLGRSVPISAQGASVGLRIAVTRLASIVTPSITGIAAEVWGVKASFYVAGVVLLTGAAALGIAARVLEKR